MRRTIVILVIVGVVLLIASLLGPYYIVTEGEQAVVVQFGKIVRVERDAGLKYKVPFVESVIKYSKKVQSWDGDAQRIPTSENQFIWVDTTARWRISDPKKFYESVGSMTQAQGRLDDVIDSEVRKIISKNPLREAVRDSNVISQIKRTNALASVAGSAESSAALSNISTLAEYPVRAHHRRTPGALHPDAERGADPYAAIRDGAHRRDHPPDQVLRRPDPERV